jgi:hypothetical protein
MALFLPVEDTIDAAELAELLYKEVKLRFRPPDRIVSNRDLRITSQFWAEICHYSIIKRRMSIAFHLQTDGQTKILNQIVKNYLRAFTNLEDID